MAELWAKMMTILSLLIAHFPAWSGFMSNFASVFMALQITLVATLKYLLTFI
jgi:hypothetical protein